MNRCFEAPGRADGSQALKSATATQAWPGLSPHCPPTYWKCSLGRKYKFLVAGKRLERMRLMMECVRDLGHLISNILGGLVFQDCVGWLRNTQEGTALLCLDETKQRGFTALQGWLAYIPSDGRFHGLIMKMC